METPQPQALDWDGAKAYFDEVHQQYRDIGFAGTFARRAVFTPLLQRYNAGERTQELYDHMMGVR